jgi:hypothetical protein
MSCILFCLYSIVKEDIGYINFTRIQCLYLRLLKRHVRNLYFKFVARKDSNGSNRTRIVMPVARRYTD